LRARRTGLKKIQNSEDVTILASDEDLSVFWKEVPRRKLDLE
jgi:hypothetical protein